MMRRALAMAAFLALLPNYSWSYDFMQVCQIQADYGDPQGLSKILSPLEWEDIKAGKGKAKKEDWIDAYLVYDAKDFELAYSNSFPPDNPRIMVWRAIYGKSRLPQNMRTKKQIAEMLKAAPEEFLNDKLNVNCDCGDVEFTFKDNQTEKMELIFISCH